MNTRLLLTSTSIFYGLIGISLTFLPDEIASYLSYEAIPKTRLLFQLIGAIYLGFAFLNWMAKGSPIGGIYNRPILIANLTHSSIAAITFIKVINYEFSGQITVITLGLCYSIIAVIFGLLLFRHPNPKTD